MIKKIKTFILDLMIKKRELELSKLKEYNNYLKTKGDTAEHTVSKVDVKYCGVPNVCFSLTKKDDKREAKFALQRRERGFDSSETWSLYFTIAKFVYPRLKVFKEVTICHPGNTTPEEWDDILDKMIRAFEIICSEESYPYDGKLAKEVDKGMKLFHKWFYALWW